MEFTPSASLTVALALAAGIVVQSLARHLRLPGIVALLATGVLLGPDVLGLVDPDRLGGADLILVEFAVAIILFEGGLNLEWRRLRRQAAIIRRLVTIGAIVTAAGGAVSVRFLLGWDWRLSVLFGTLVIVTGPTVITPLLRRIKVKRNLETILEAEGVFIDAVGAIVALVALEVALSWSSDSLAIGFLHLPTRLVFGTVFGLAGGFIMWGVLRFRGLVPEGLENVFTLSLVLALFQISNAIMPETGIMAVIAAGLVLGNMRTHVQRDLKEFKEQLTVMLIGMLFVILAADVRVRNVTDLGWPGVVVVLALMLVVRPINVIVCTVGTKVSWREIAFLSWLAPRGIVAAAVASLFYVRLSHEGIEGGIAMRALVFLVIATTVLFQGSTGGLVARLLGVRRPSGRGYAILGAHELGRLLAKLLVEAGEEVVLIDSNAQACTDAEAEGFRVVHGNALEERVHLTADLESRSGVLGTVTNGAVNILFARKAREEYKVPRAYAAVQRGDAALNPDMVHDAGAGLLFADQTDLELWSVRIRREIAHIEQWKIPEELPEGERSGEPAPLDRKVRNALLPMAVRKGQVVEPFDDRSRPSSNDVVLWLVFEERAEDAHAWLRDNGWEPVATE